MTDAQLQEYPLQQLPKLPEIQVLPFIRGGSLFMDLKALVGERNARLAMTFLVSYCQQHLAGFAVNLEAICAMGSLNPENIQSVPDIIMEIGMELWSECVAYRLFQIGMKSLPFEFHDIGPARLYLRRLKA